jgi:hypothetical protein
MESDSEIISQLKFIGRIGKGEKVNVRQKTVQPHGLRTSFVRTFYDPDTRWNLLNFITNVLKRSFGLIQVKLASNKISGKAYCAQVIHDINTAKDEGIPNVKITYADDVKFCCDIETLIQDIDSKMEGLKQTFPEIFNYIPIKIEFQNNDIGSTSSSPNGNSGGSYFQIGSSPNNPNNPNNCMNNNGNTGNTSLFRGNSLPPEPIGGSLCISRFSSQNEEA